MSAPDPSLIVANPPPLNLLKDWPYFLDEFPAKELLDSYGVHPKIAAPPERSERAALSSHCAPCATKSPTDF